MITLVKVMENFVEYLQVKLCEKVIQVGPLVEIFVLYWLMHSSVRVRTGIIPVISGIMTRVMSVMKMVIFLIWSVEGFISQFKIE